MISTRKDLDALAGTPEHDAFMQMLEGSLYRVHFDTGTRQWVATEDDTMIARYGFALTDFPDRQAPDLGGKTPPPPAYPTADAAKAAMIQWASDFMASVTGPVPIDERLSWDAKEAAARAYVAETADAAQTAMIDGEAAITGEVPADLAAIIIARADTFRAVVSRVAGLRRKTIAAIDAVTDPADYEVALAAAKAEAITLAAALGITVPGEG